MAAARGRFIPKNPQKCIGNPNDIWFRSSWEIVAMKRFDSNPAVLKWGSEAFPIPYIKPTDGRVHNYFPDFIVIYKDNTGQIVKAILEVKPLKESIAKEGMNDHDKIAQAINAAKWTAAAAFCERNGMKFQVITERSLFIQTAPKTPKARGPRKSTGTVKPRGTKRGK